MPPISRSTHYQHLREELVAEPRTWLVTGVAGFIGSNLLQELLALGQTVIGPTTSRPATERTSTKC
jgi:hypothetical protein